MLTRRHASYTHPFSLMNDFRRQLEQVLGDLDVARPNLDPTGDRSWSAFEPRFGLHEDETGFTITADVPGLKPAELNVKTENGTLIIQGERAATEPEGYRPLRRERGGVRFERRFTLSDVVDAEKIEAKLDAGVLTVRLGRRAQTQPRTIEIKTV